MKIGVTGASGFIGTNLCKELLAVGHKVVKYDDPIQSEACVDSFVSACDFVVHLAGCNRGEDRYLLRTNVVGTFNVAQACTFHKVPLLFISSTYPRKSAYRASKRISENLVQEFACNLGLKATTLKLPKVFGSHCKPNYNSFVGTILWSMAKNKPFEHLIPDNSAPLELAHVDSVTTHIISWVNNFQPHSFPFTINGEIYTIKDVIDLANTDDGNLFWETKQWYIQNM